VLGQLSGATRLFPIIGDPIKYVESPMRLTRTFGCKTANGGHMVEAAQDVMADFMLRKTDSPTGVTATLQQGDRAGWDH